MNNELKKQIKDVYIYTFFTGMMFWYGIEQLFLEEIGDGVFARGIVLAVFSITMLLANIPTGAISDIWGRVRSLKIAILMMLIGLIVMGLSQSILHYVIGSIFVGLFWSFDEGAKEAFVYDLLADHKKQELYQRTLGKMYAALLIGAAIANFLSGILASASSLRAMFFLSVIPCVVAYFFVSKLEEPDHHKQIGKKIIHQLDDALKAIGKSQVLLAIVVGQTLIYTIATIADNFSQVVVTEHTSSAVLLGFSWGVIGLLMAAGNLGAHRIKHIFRFIGMLLVLISAYFLAQESWLSIIPLFLFAGGMEAVSIRGEGALQNNTGSHLRATISSVPGSASMFITALLALWVGSTDGTIAPKMFAICFSLLLVTLILWLRIKSHIPKE